MSFAKLDLVDLLVIVVLGGALILAILHSMNELAMSIASGMIGYIGSAARSADASVSAVSEKKGE